MARGKLGVTYQRLVGKLGNTVLTETKQGLIVREFVDPSNPQTAAQMAVRLALTKSAQAYKGMTTTQVQAWETYAAGKMEHDPASGADFHPSAINAFVKLAAKFLQVSPTGTIPLTPPTSAFTGDTPVITVDASAPGVLNFVASGANSAGVKTELLIQRLPSANRKPTPKGYKHLAFVAYTSTTLDYEVTLPAGYYAAAYRFVKTATGEATLAIPLGINTVTFSLEQGGSGRKTKAA